MVEYGGPVVPDPRSHKPRSLVGGEDALLLLPATGGCGCAHTCGQPSLLCLSSPAFRATTSIPLEMDGFWEVGQPEVEKSCENDFLWDAGHFGTRDVWEGVAKEAL
jgi:hypothetical protein